MIARLTTPFALAFTEVLAVEADEGTIHVAVVAREGEDTVVRQAARGAATGDLALDLPAALAALGGRSRPRRAILITPRATAVVLQVPPIQSLAAERVQGLVRYELEPYLSGAARDGGDLACGWGDRGADGDRPGPLLACGLTAAARDEAREAFRRAGLQLAGIYPQLGCAAALLPQDAAQDAVVLEHAAGRLAASRVVGGQVSRLVLQRAPGDPGDLARACRGLCDDAPVVVAGPADPDLLADSADLAPATWPRRRPRATTRRPRPGPGQRASAPPATRWACPAARVAAVAAQPQRPPLHRQPAVQALVVAALPLLLAVGVDVVVRGRLDTARAAAVELQAEVDVRQRAAAARKALERERDAIVRSMDPLKAAAAEHAEAEGRREWLLGLLRGVARAASADVVVRAVEEEPGGAVRVEGVARAETDVQAFVRDVAATPALAGRPPRGATIQRQEGRLGGVSYRFEVRFGDAAAPSRAASDLRGGD
ncbi:MAG: hypothetical protein KF878_09300 [Planctomycetes bacterium]|nr:hypothetical protein [Planctomycetota bacterium]